MNLRFTVLLCCVAGSASTMAQDVAGKHVILSTVSFVRSSQKVTIDPPILGPEHTRATVTAVGAEILFGKINKKNLLFAYGLQATIQTQRYYQEGEQVGKATTSALYPTLLLQKYFTMSERFWFTPSARIRARYKSKDDVRRIEGIAQFNPLAVSIAISKRINLQIGGGEISVSSQHQRFRDQGDVSKSNAFALTGNFESWSALVQINL